MQPESTGMQAVRNAASCASVAVKTYEHTMLLLQVSRERSAGGYMAGRSAWDLHRHQVLF